MAAREFVRIGIESTYGVTKTSPVLGTDMFYMRLDREGAFAPSPAPNVVEIPYGGGFVTKADEADDTVGVPFRFQFRLFPGLYSSTLLNWAITPINSGRTAPWVTTVGSNSELPVGDLASLTFYHAVLKEDGATYDRKKYLGCKCTDWELSAQETGDGRVWTISGNGRAQKVVGNPWDVSADPDATEFAAPADTDYPTAPYVFGDLGRGTGTVTIATNRAATCYQLRMRGRNTLAPNFYTGRFLFADRFCGREVTAEVGLRYKASPDDRLSFWSRTQLSTEFLLDCSTNTIKIDFNAKNTILPWERQLPLDREYMQMLTLKNSWDPALGTDITLTTT
jgi:hypothetical protein